MPKENKSKPLNCLANDTAWEMTPDELEQALNAELDKPADEIDAVLVQEILQALDAEKPDPQRMKADWALVKSNLPKRRANPRIPQWTKRFGAAAAVIAILMVTTLRAADAFPWIFIEKILAPVAQTFGIVIDDQTDMTPSATDAPEYTVSDAPSSTTAYQALDDVPEYALGYAIRPRWLPDGFTFRSGSLFSSVDSEIYTMDFENGDAWLNLQIHIITSDEAVYSREFERTLEVPIEIPVGEHTVTFYRNAEDTVQSSFWIYENAHYMLAGEITVESILHFVDSMD